MNRSRWLILIMFSALVAPGLEAILRAADPARNPYRYLFLVEDSQAMAPHAEAVAGFVADTVRHGFDGWMRRGDTIGFWTFSDRIRQDVFSVEFWTPSQRERIASEAEQFFRQHRFQRAGRMDLALSAVNRLAERTDEMTVFLVNDARHRVRGTPFDVHLNEAYAARERTAGAAGNPLVTRLTVQRGELTAWAVEPIAIRSPTPAPAVVELVPAGREPVPSASTPVAPAPVEAPASVDEVAPEPPPAAITLAAPAEAPISLPPPPELPSELTEPIRIAPLTYDEDGNGATPRPRLPAIVLSAETDYAKKEPDAQSPTADSGVAGRQRPAGVGNGEAGIALPAKVESAAASAPAQNGTPASKGTERAAGPASQSVGTSRVPGGGVADVPSAAVKPGGAGESGRLEPAVVNDTTLATVSGSDTGARMYLVIGLLLLTVTGVIIWRLLRRSRPAPPASLISRSMDPKG